MRSMKNLAFMETRRLVRLIEQQQDVVGHIESVAADFLSFHPQMLPPAGRLQRTWLVIGSRRGFCGDFNEQLVAGLQAALADEEAGVPYVIGVGHKLCSRLGSVPGLSATLEGADVAEEVPAVLSAVVAELDRCREQHGVLELNVLYQQAQRDELKLSRLLPPFIEHRAAPQRYGNPPQLNLEPRHFFLELGGQYLYAALHGVLFESLLAENQRRVRHLDGAVRHLVQRVGELRRRMQALRQEEIIEEIEVILLNASSLDSEGVDTET